MVENWLCMLTTLTSLRSTSYAHFKVNPHALRLTQEILEETIFSLLYCPCRELSLSEESLQNKYIFTILMSE